LIFSLSNKHFSSSLFFCGFTAQARLFLVLNDIPLFRRTTVCLLVHTYNPSDSGDKDHEDRSWKPARANSSQDPISKNPPQKKAGVAPGEGPKFKPQYHKNKKAAINIHVQVFV
jgi:hypothetical protein